MRLNGQLPTRFRTFTSPPFIPYPTISHTHNPYRHRTLSLLYRPVCSALGPLFGLARPFAGPSYKTYSTTQQHGKHSAKHLNSHTFWSRFSLLWCQTWVFEILIRLDTNYPGSSMKLDGQFAAVPHGFPPNLLALRTPGVPIFDRTRYIATIESYTNRALLFLRPRRYGKTFTVSMQ